MAAAAVEHFVPPAITTTRPQSWASACGSAQAPVKMRRARDCSSNDMPSQRFSQGSTGTGARRLGQFSVIVPMMVADAAAYQDLCSGCPQAERHLVPCVIPDRGAATAVASQVAATLIRAVLRGAQTVATQEEPTDSAMPAFGWQLTSAQVAAVTTNVRNT